MALAKITSVTGRAVPVVGNDIDTDRIIPARFMKCVTFDGLGEFLFFDVRQDPDTGKITSHALNDARFKGATILLETLGHPLGFWTSLVGPQNQFVHLWGYDSLADYETRCRARDTHPDFPKYLAASGHLITAQETRLIRRAELSSMKGLA